MKEERRKAESDGPRIWSDYFYMSENGVSTPMLVLKFSRSGRIAAWLWSRKV